MSPGKVMLFIIGTIVVVFGAYYVTYYIGMKSTKLRRGAGRSIVLRDRFAISKDKSFCLVEIQGNIYVVGVTNQSMTLLDTLKAEDFITDDVKGGAAQNPADGLFGGVAGGLASLIAGHVRRTPDRSANSGTEGGTFAEKLKKSGERFARARETSELPDENKPDEQKTDNPEDRE